jgi:hypothetical protein
LIMGSFSACILVNVLAKSGETGKEDPFCFTRHVWPF